jgi:uncharacterized membrane protein
MNKANPKQANSQSQKSTVAGILIGIGMGGFVDGIVLHQILQWHNMLSNLFPPATMENMRVNMVWDGAFHALVWLITLAGIFMLRSAAYQGFVAPSLQSFVGQLILGWGLFNLVEGIIDHQILGLHYVRQVPNFMVYNLTFLAVGGVLFMVAGWLLMHGGRRVSAEALANREAI